MNRDGLSPEEWCLIAVVMCCVAGVVGYAAGKSGSFTVADGAAWFQAVFSVIAIGVAVWVSRSDHRRQAAVSAEAEKDSVIGIVILIHRGVALIDSLSDADFGRASSSAIHSLHVLAEKLESLDLIIRPSPVLLRGSLHAANNIRIYIQDLENGKNLDRLGLARRMEREAERILKFYNLSESDLPKQKGSYRARA